MRTSNPGTALARACLTLEINRDLGISARVLSPRDIRSLLTRNPKTNGMAQNLGETFETSLGG